jgi:hypothetical protein
MDAAAQTCLDEGSGGVFERPGAVQYDRDALQGLIQRRVVIDIEDAPLDGKFIREAIQPGAVPAGGYHLKAGAGRRPHGMFTDIARGAVDQKHR